MAPWRRSGFTPPPFIEALKPVSLAAFGERAAPGRGKGPLFRREEGALELHRVPLHNRVALIAPRRYIPSCRSAPNF